MLARRPYSFRKLVKLAIDSFTSQSVAPLKVSMYTGLVIVGLSLPAIVFVIIDRYLLNDLTGFGFSGTAVLGLLTVLLTGVTLFNIGLMSYYVARISQESLNRPLYVIRRDKNKK